MNHIDRFWDVPEIVATPENKDYSDYIRLMEAKIIGWAAVSGAMISSEVIKPAGEEIIRTGMAAGGLILAMAATGGVLHRTEKLRQQALEI